MQGVPFIPDTAPFSVAQRVWLNGFLAGLFARETISTSAAAKEPGPSVPLLILYGSQTGTAEALARRMATEAKNRGCTARVVDAAAHATIDWKKERHLFIVTSTYGEGDPPDNAQNFWQWLQTDDAAVLAHLNFAVLALGDRNYTEFCAAGKKMDERLEALGAKRIYPRSDCDVDYEPVAKAWMEGAFVALLNAGANGAGAAQSVSVNGSANGHAPAPAEIAAPKFSKTNPFPACLLKNICLTRPGSGKEVRHYEISLHDSGLAYEVGDALGVMPMNCPELVGEFLSVLNCQGDEAVKIGESEMPLRDALSRHLDITKPSSDFLAAMAQRSPGNEWPALLAPERTADLKQWLFGRGVIDLLAGENPFPAAELVKCLRKLAPRLYSISSSPKAHLDEVHLTVGAVRYESHGRARKGVASTYLADRIGEAGCVRVFVQPSHGFKLPPDGSVPIIMVGPGTGIAPFRAFLEERQAVGAKGRNWLFFGDQKRATDFLYEEQLSGWLKDGHLTRLDLAFSRDQSEKIYVQQRMLESAVVLWAWLQDGAHFYVCGDASRMAKDVDAALHHIAATTGGLGQDGAVEFVRRLKSARRYQRDVY
jgi:sulfite reductase (NADPH) flavoprotein alpha-component